MNKKLIAWIVSSDTGASSLTLWTVMMGEPCDKYPSIPYDSDDFGRCHRLLQLIPESQRTQILKEAAEAYPNWIPFAREWTKLTELCLKEYTEGTGMKINKLMHRLVKESESIRGT